MKLAELQLCYAIVQEFSDVTGYDQKMVRKYFSTKGGHICKECDYIDISEHRLEVHRLLTHETKGSTCLICKKKHIRAITHHLKSNHPTEYLAAQEIGRDEVKNLYINELGCKFCEFSSAFQYLLGHIRNEHIAERIRCNICGEEMQKSAIYDHRTNKHSDESKLYRTKCDVCYVQFKHDKQYARHIVTQTHMNNIKKKEALDLGKYKGKIYKCTECSASFFTQYEQGSHLRKIHQIEVRKFKCDNCGSRYKTEKKCMQHSEKCTENIDEKKRRENEDEDEDDAEEEYTEPLEAMYDKDAKLFKCSHPKCTMESKRKDAVMRHIRTVHNKVFVKCEFCNQYKEKREYIERHRNLCERNIDLKGYPGSSSWERIVSKFLIKNDIDFISQKKFVDLKRKNPLPYDFYLPEYNMLIEINGTQHYEAMSYHNAETKLLEIQDSDKRKRKYARENKYEYLEIDTRKYKTEKLVHNLLNDSIEI